MIPKRWEANQVSPTYAPAYCLEKVPAVMQKGETQVEPISLHALRTQSLEVERPKHLEFSGWNTQGKRAAQRENSSRIHHHVRVRK